MAEPGIAHYSACGEGGGTDISSGTISTIIAATALLGLGIAALEIIRRRSEPTARDDRLVQAVDDMRSRMDDLGRDLSEALERAERESRRNRFLSDLGTSIEFDELLDRVLDAALEVPGFDAAMVSLDEHGGGTADDRDAGHDRRGGGAPTVVGCGRRAPGGADHRELPLWRRRRRRHAADPRWPVHGARRPGGAPAREPRALLAHAGLRALARAGRRRSSRSRRPASRPSRTRAGTGRRGSSRRPTRSPGSSTSATSTRRSAGRRSARSATTGSSRS